jgi:peptidoglycan/LPS O-acetylase OafA/YrhL
VVGVVFLVLRYVQLRSNLDFGRFAPLFDKWNFGIVRIFNFTAASVLLIRLRSVLKPLAIRPLVRLGQASLPVFCIHLLCVFMALTIMGNNDYITGWRAVALVIGSISALMLTAIVVTRRRERSRAAQTRVLPLKVHAPRTT